MILLGVMTAIIVIVNHIKNLNLFLFAEFQYSLIEKLVILIYIITAMDEYGLRFVRFDNSTDTC